MLGVAVRLILRLPHFFGGGGVSVMSSPELPAPKGDGVTGMSRSARTVIAASFIGTTIEWYDFFLYGTASALVLPALAKTWGYSWARALWRLAVQGLRAALARWIYLNVGFRGLKAPGSSTASDGDLTRSGGLTGSPVRDRHLATRTLLETV